MHCHVQMCGATLAFAHTSRAPLRAWRCLLAGIGRAPISQAARRLHALLERVEAAIETELSAHIGAPRRHAALRLRAARQSEGKASGCRASRRAARAASWRAAACPAGSVRRDSRAAPLASWRSRLSVSAAWPHVPSPLRGEGSMALPQKRMGEGVHISHRSEPP